MDSRAAFEAWCRQQPVGSLTLSWDAWQASRLAALEEAAMVCDRQGFAINAAAEIRTLAQGGGK